MFYRIENPSSEFDPPDSSSFEILCPPSYDPKTGLVSFADGTTSPYRQGLELEGKLEREVFGSFGTIDPSCGCVRKRRPLPKEQLELEDR